MKLKTLLLGLTILVAYSSQTKAQSDSSYTFSLKKAQEYAIENYFVSKNAKLDIEIAKKQILETTAMGLPQVQATADFQYIPNPPKFDFVDFDTGEPTEIALATETNTTYGATVSQLIFSGEYIVGLQAAKVYRTYSEENYDKTKIDMRQNIASSYYTILILEANKEVLNKTLEALQSNLDEVKKTFDAGLIEESEVDQLQLTVKRTDSDLTSLENQTEYMNNLFKYQLGLTANSEITLTENLEDLLALNIIQESAYSFSLEDNIEYKILSTNEELQQLSLNREKTAYLPTIAGFYSYSDQTSATDFSPTINHVIGVSATWDIFQSGSRYAKISQAKLSLEQSRNVKDQEAERLKLVSQQSKYDYQTALSKYNNEKLNFELSEKVFDKTNKKYKLGMVSSLELSIVNTQFLSAQISYSAAIQELLTAKVALDKAYNKL